MLDLLTPGRLLDVGQLRQRNCLALRVTHQQRSYFGQVLWVQGIKEEAKEVWQSALKNYPDNEVLISTMKRFMK